MKILSRNNKPSPYGLPAPIPRRAVLNDRERGSLRAALKILERLQSEMDEESFDDEEDTWYDAIGWSAGYLDRILSGSTQSGGMFPRNYVPLEHSRRDWLR